jgi:hypothetical protein
MESKARRKDNKGQSSKTQARRDDFEKIDDRIDDSLGNTSTNNSSYNSKLKNSSSGIKRREQFKTREEDRSNTAEQPAYPGFYEENNTGALYTTKAEPLREQRFNNLPSDPMAAREALRDQYERAKGITGEKAPDITGEKVPEENDISHMNKENIQNNLEGLGIKWSNNGTNTDEEAEKKAMSTVYNVTMRLPENLRRKFSMEMIDENPDNVGGTTYPTSARVELFTKNNKTGEKFDANTLERNAVHELGHIVDSGMAEGKFNMTNNPSDRYHGLKDEQGRDLFERTQNLEAWAKAKGYNPEQGSSLPAGLSEYRQSLMKKRESGEITSDEEVKLLDNRKWDELGKKQNPNFIYDKYDPHVHSLNYQDKSGNNQEKYARQDKREYFAETFTTYVMDKDEFKQKMSNMEDYLKINKPGTDEYKYVKESLSIMRDSYGTMQKLFNEKDG